eukprot:TRINITY_DN51890_c0_g1_i1.p1 TRINITY_DN51890_c0_g1~~TRINITY_DN51890_c0_g1_i1.p1  ORF type:complete len:464 (+),score=83.69 TRINITY_DN51890_c0_g1_i1:112-1503(+)
MVVQYPSGITHGKWTYLSFFWVTPRVLFYRSGSVFPFILPQVVTVFIFSMAATILEKVDMAPVKTVDSSHAAILGFLLSFLMVFKTNAAYQQYWAALGAVDGMLQSSRTVGMSVCSDTDWRIDGVEEKARSCLRLVGLHYYVLCEKFQRTAKYQVDDPRSPAKRKQYDAWRDAVRNLATLPEMEMLYPNEDPDTPGADSKHPCANPSVVVFWIKLLIGHILHEKKALAPPICNGMSMHINALLGHSAEMEKIDKTQFPLPYAQIVKLFLCIFVYLLPFLLAKETGWATPGIATLAAMGFYGLDIVAEILEAPFGQDANDIDLSHYGQALLADLELFYNMRHMNIETVVGGDQELSFAKLLSCEKHTHKQAMIDGFNRVKRRSVVERSSQSFPNGVLASDLKTGLLTQPTGPGPDGINNLKLPDLAAGERGPDTIQQSLKFDIKLSTIEPLPPSVAAAAAENMV